jgi:multicomponent K+:H+ antiporter subunit F
MIVQAVLPWVSTTLALAMVPAAWRLLRGPGVCDRILALDTLNICALALLVVLGMQRGHTLYFELALLIGLLGFVGSVALARFAQQQGSAP